MSKKLKNYPVTKRVNWALTCKDKMTIPYWSYEKDGEIYAIKKAYKFSYSLNGVISFNNHMHLLVKLNPAAHHLLMYLVQVMDSATNEFHYDKSARLYFIDFMKEKCGISVKEGTVRRALGLLKQVGYVIKRSKAKRLIINPRYYYRGTMKERETLFRELLHEASHPKTKNHDIKLKLNLRC